MNIHLVPNINRARANVALKVKALPHGTGLRMPEPLVTRGVDTVGLAE